MFYGVNCEGAKSSQCSGAPTRLLPRSPGMLKLPQGGSWLLPRCGDCAGRGANRERKDALL